MDTSYLQIEEPVMDDPITEEMEQAWKELEQRFSYECWVETQNARIEYPVVEVQA